MNSNAPNFANAESNVPGRELAGSRPLVANQAGHDLSTSHHLRDFRQKRLIMGRLDVPGDVHVFSAECGAGERLRLQTLVPVLPMGGAVVPAFAVIAQSLPYSADVHKLPFPLPAGFSAVVAPPPSELASPIRDILTRVRYYLGPVVDTRTLVSGRCYVVVWSPQNQMGKYGLQVGHRWPLDWFYWLNIPRYWWQIRGWFGLSRAAAYIAVVVIALLAMITWRGSRRRQRNAG